MNKPSLPLRDIHLPASPSWWPPAPGWWVLVGLLLIALTWFTQRMLDVFGRRRRNAAILREYDTAIADAPDAPARLAAASLLLRRAARALDPAAAVLEGDAWLRFLDGDDPARPFSQSDGMLFRDGAFRRTIDADIAPTLSLARSRFASLLQRSHREQGHA